MSSSSSVDTTAHCGLWPVELCPSIFSYLLPTLSIFSLPALEDLFLLPLSIISFILPGFSIVCTFHVARVISVYLVFFRPSSFNLSSFFICSTFVTVSFFTGWGCYPHANPPTWRTRVSVFVWVITFDMSGMEGPTTSIRYRQRDRTSSTTTSK